MNKVYFDTSALFKEFENTIGSDLVDKIIVNAKEGKVQIISSIWSINEAVAVIDRKYRKGELQDAEAQIIFATLSDRIETSTEKASFSFKRITHSVVTNSRVLISIFHISPSDALHLHTAFYHDCNYFLVHDNELVKRIMSSNYRFEGMEVVNLGSISDREYLAEKLGL